MIPNIDPQRHRGRYPAWHGEATSSRWRALRVTARHCAMIARFSRAPASQRRPSCCQRRRARQARHVRTRHHSRPCPSRCPGRPCCPRLRCARTLCGRTDEAHVVTQLRFTIQIKDRVHMVHLIHNVRGVAGVTRVEREGDQLPKFPLATLAAPAHFPTARMAKTVVLIKRFFRACVNSIVFSPKFGSQYMHIGKRRCPRPGIAAQRDH